MSQQSVPFRQPLSFGQQRPVFGQTTTSTMPFGQTPGQQQPLPFGHTVGHSTAFIRPFGQSSAPIKPFGQQPLPFGQSAAPINPFGQQPLPFGPSAAPIKPFGQQPLPFGQSSAPIKPFGHQPLPFGPSAAPIKPFGQQLAATTILAFGHQTATFGQSGQQLATKPSGQQLAATPILAFGQTNVGQLSVAAGPVPSQAFTPFSLQAEPFRQSQTSVGQPVQSFGLTSTWPWDTQPSQPLELHQKGLGKYLLLNNIDNILNYAEALQKKTRQKSQ